MDKFLDIHPFKSLICKSPISTIFPGKIIKNLNIYVNIDGHDDQRHHGCDVHDEREGAGVSPTMETNGASGGRSHITQHPQNHAWHTAHNTQHTAHSTWRMANGTQNTAYGTRHTAHGTWHTANST